MDDLNMTICFVTFIFSDGSRQTIRTTLNHDLLCTYGVSQRDGYLYDFKHAEYVPMREDAVSVEVSQEEPDTERGLIGFANRFI